MLLIPCPWCGPRAETEFSCAGEARAPLVDEPGLDDAAWADRLYGRDNRRGEADELWWHAHGCQQWLRLRRDTLTHEVLQARPALDDTTGTGTTVGSGAPLPQPLPREGEGEEIVRAGQGADR